MLIRALIALLAVTLGSSISPRSWMGDARVADSRFGDLSLWRMTLPGSHDTLSYDLSDELTELPSAPPAVGNIVRTFAVTQSLSITDQLDAGIRFLDFRVMRSPDGGWYGTHTVRTRRPALDYLAEIARWLDASDGEYLVVFLSRHGAECLKGEDQYPHVAIADKQDFWAQFESAARGHIMQARHITSSLSSLRATRRSGMFVLASDHEEMTGNSSMALDACAWLNNTGGGGRPSRWQYSDDRLYMKDLLSPERSGKYYLRSMASAASREEVLAHIASESWVPTRWRSIADSDCARAYGLPVPSGYCAPDLSSLGKFCNYYNRRVLIDYLNLGAHPNAFYVDMVTVDGGLQVSDADEFDFYGLVMVMNINSVCTEGCSAELLRFAAARKGNWTVAWPNSSELGLTSIPPELWA